MAEYDNSGSLGKNERKEKDTHPDIRGKAIIGGVKYWIDGWARKGDDGKPWYSLTFKRQDKQASALERQPERQPERRAQGIPGLGDDIPF